MREAEERLSLQGRFLIAQTDLEDPNFFHTVVLVVHHDESGAFGLVLTRASETTVGEALEEVSDLPFAAQPVYVGGPVDQGYIFTLHSGLPARYHSDDSRQVSDKLYFEPSFDHIVRYQRDLKSGELFPREEGKVNVYAGYAGWSAGQLEEEIEREAWYTSEVDEQVVFTSPARGWHRALSNKGEFYRIVAETGHKPSLN